MSGLEGAGRMVARTRRIDRDVDLLAVAGRHGVLFERGRTGLAGRGEALRLPWPAGDPATAARTVAEALAAIETDDEVDQPGSGPVAFGALPFRPGAAAELVVPRIVIARAEDGTRWLTTIETTDGAATPTGDLETPGRPDLTGSSGARRDVSGADLGVGADAASALGDDPVGEPASPTSRPSGHGRGDVHDAGPPGVGRDPARSGEPQADEPLVDLLDDVAAGRVTARDGDELLRRLTSGPGAGGERLPLPRRFTVESRMDPDEWCALVERATKVLADRHWSGPPSSPDPGPGPGSPLDPAGTGGRELSKVVLAREFVVTADRPLDRAAVLARLRAAYPGCHVASVDGFVGASPELLVSRSGDMVRSHPMAGTAPRGGDPTTDQRLAASLLASAKDRAEHQITIDMVHDTLLGWCSYLDYEAEPSVVAVANVQHLATLVEGRLSRPAPSVLELVAALHPTPAVAGWPPDEAVAWIAAHEGFDRGRYAGTVGWADGRGNGTWAVAVRCAEMDGTMARVFAGNGIVADSDPQTELAETQAKVQALLSAIVRP